MPRFLKPVIYLHPPRGPALVFTDNETWLGRNSLELSEKAQLLCSRKQACLKITDTAVTLECHGLNPIYFVVCHSADFEATEDAPPCSLHQLKRGESVELIDGDKFFLVPKECLLTVEIKPSKSDPDESTAAVQLTPDAVVINTHDERIFPEPEATQQGSALTSSPVGQHGPLQTGALSNPLVAEVRVNFADTCFTRSVSPREPAVHESVLCPPENSSKSSDVIIPRSCFGASSVEDSPVRQVDGASSVEDSPVREIDSSTKVPNADPTHREVVIDIVSDRASSIGASRSTFVADDCRTPDFSRLDLSGAGDSLSTTLGVTRAAGTSLDGKGCGSSNAAPKPILVRSFQTSSPGCPGPEQVQGDMPFAAISDPRQDNLLRRELSPRHRNSDADSLPESVPRPARAPLDCVSNGLPIHDSVPRPASPPLDCVSNGLPIHDGRQMHPKQPEMIDLTRFENERDAQAQIEARSLEDEHAVGRDYGTGPIEGMKNVVVTISGYEDLLRARLINLITVTGASYTGSLTKVNTHVVCWKFKGAKYEMAKKLGKIIVNHCWFEDCQKAGSRLSEEPYKASGEMAKALHWDQSSSLQHPSSSAGFDRDQNCNSLLLSGEHSQGQVLGIGGPSTHRGKRVGRFCRSDSSSRNENDMLDRGKRQVDLNSSTNRLQGGNSGTVAHNCEGALQMRTLTISGDSPPVDLSAPHPAQEQESDEFWNEAIRANDDRNNQVESDAFWNDVIRPDDDINNQVMAQSRQVVPIANHRAELMEHTTGRTRHTAAPSPGSSLRELDPERTRRTAAPSPGSSIRELDPEFHVEIRNGRRPAIANEADPSFGFAQGEGLQEGMPSSVREQSDNVQSEVDQSSSNPEVFQRKRRHAMAVGQVRYQKFKRRRLPKPGDPPGRRLPCYVGYAPIREPPTSNNGSVQESASTADAEDDGQQSANLINADSSGKAAEKGGESASSSEITCVICHADTKPTTEGVLACGHQFCFRCIQRWADEAKSKSPTCPLCKVPFDFITFRGMDKAGADGSCAVLEERIVQVRHQILDEPCLENLCIMCGSMDNPELLLVCTHCRERAIHTFCHDPPCPQGSSWSCSRCSQMHSRTQIREIYGRLFQGVSLAQQRQGTPDAMIPAPPSWSISRARPLLRPPMPRIPLGGNLAPQSGSTSRVGGLAGGQFSATPPQRRRQTPLDNFLVRQNDG